MRMRPVVDPMTSVFRSAKGGIVYWLGLVTENVRVSPPNLLSCHTWYSSMSIQTSCWGHDLPVTATGAPSA